MDAQGIVESAGELWIKARYDQLVLEQQTDYCLIALTLKNFAEYSRRIGPQAAAEAVRTCYALLRKAISTDGYIAHIHSCYFILLVRCPAVAEDLHQLAARLHFIIRDAMEEAYGRKLFLEMGFYPMMKEGVDFYTAQHFADLCRQSDHHAFPETNYDIYYLSYNDRKEAFRQYESMVEPALANGDFKLFLQPKVDLRTGQVVAAEALVRWIDPVLGMIPLSSFLPHLEENGSIREVDLYLFDKACQYLERWQQAYGKHYCISFNLSRAYFNGNYFMPEYTATFEKYQLPPSCVRIELVESIVLNDLNKLKPLVKQIQDYGFSCALDDFGSGFSSFDILTAIQLSELKIDRALFQDSNNIRERILIKHLVDTAHDLNMEVVAEGVETGEYAYYLKSIGCDFIQGYYFYKPMPVDEFEQRFVVNDEQTAL